LAPILPAFALGAPGARRIPRKENWEKPEEMLTPILQRKYPDRAIVCATEICFGYCTFCFRSLQSTYPGERHGGLRHWARTLRVLADNPDIEEVIISGGEPLILSDDRLETLLRDLRGIRSVRTIRIHTRAGTHNPYRFGIELGRLLKRYDVTALCLHVQHPRELTKDLAETLDKLRDAHPRLMLLSQTVLMKGVNDDSTTLGRLFMDLYRLGIKPYYLFHMMPNIPAADAARTSVMRGAVIMDTLRRKMTSPALPEYVLSPVDGKQTVPYGHGSNPDFRYKMSIEGKPVVRFRNWQDRWVEYPDVPDSPLDRHA
jgi:lysine 2,3-aminomutase